MTSTWPWQVGGVLHVGSGGVHRSILVMEAGVRMRGDGMQEGGHMRSCMHPTYGSGCALGVPAEAWQVWVHRAQVTPFGCWLRCRD